MRGVLVNVNPMDVCILLQCLSNSFFNVFDALHNSFLFFVLCGAVVDVCWSSKQIFSNISRNTTNLAILHASTTELMRLGYKQIESGDADDVILFEP